MPSRKLAERVLHAVNRFPGRPVCLTGERGDWRSFLRVDLDDRDQLVPNPACPKTIDR